MLSPLALLILVIATLTLAAPLPELEGNSTLSERATIPGSVTCESRTPWSHTFTSNFIVDAKNHLIQFMNLPNNHPLKPSTNTGIIYPHVFWTNNQNTSPKVINALNDDNECRTGQQGTTYLEYPMADIGLARAWTEGDPDANQVLVMVKGNQIGQYHTPVYCLSMAHEVRPSPNMAPCSSQ